MRRILCAVPPCIALLTVHAHATAIISVGGDLTTVSMPAELNYDNTLFSGVTNPSPIIFIEYSYDVMPVFSATDPSNPVLASRGISPAEFIGSDFLPLDISAPGDYPPGVPNGGQVDSGTPVASYIIHYEPSDTNPVGSTIGSVTFDENVLGLEFPAEDAPVREMLFEPSNINFSGSSGLELGCDDPTVCDAVTLSTDLRTVSFSFNVDGATDDVRIFVSVPEPSSFALFAVAVSLLPLFRTRNQVEPVRSVGQATTSLHRRSRRHLTRPSED